MVLIGNNGVLVKIAATLGVIVYTATMMRLYSVVSLCFAFSIMCIAASYVVKLMNRKRIDIADLALFAVAILAVFKAGLQANFDYYKPAIIVVCTVICIDLCPDNDSDETGKKYIISLFVFATIATNIMYYLGGLRYEYFGRTDSVALNFSNPNETAMWLASIFIILANAISEEKTKFRKSVIVVCCISIIPILVPTESRACLIAVVFFVFFKILFKLTHVKKLPSWIIYLVTFAPIIVFFFYMYVVIPHLDLFTKWFFFMISDGKSLTSRLWIWGILKDDLIGCFVLGKYDVYFSEQMHNSLGTLYGRFGIFFVCIICNKFVKMLKRMDDVNAQLAMCAVWIIGCFEMAFFAGAGGLYLLILVLPLIGRTNLHTEALFKGKLFGKSKTV